MLPSKIVWQNHGLVQQPHVRHAVLQERNRLRGPRRAVEAGVKSIMGFGDIGGVRLHGPVCPGHPND